jgi:hypothetical protein
VACAGREGAVSGMYRNVRGCKKLKYSKRCCDSFGKREAVKGFKLFETFN